jgi:hypothetical protein
VVNALGDVLGFCDLPGKKGGCQVIYPRDCQVDLAEVAARGCWLWSVLAAAPVFPYEGTNISFMNWEDVICS